MGCFDDSRMLMENDGDHERGSLRELLLLSRWNVDSRVYCDCDDWRNDSWGANTTKWICTNEDECIRVCGDELEIQCCAIQSQKNAKETNNI